jgi:recombination protein RecA
MPPKKKARQTSFESVEALIKSVSKEFHGAIDEEENVKDVVFQTTNIIGLDFILGGGRPVGRIIEVFGPESCGKTGMALHMMSICQRLGGTVALIDAEYAYDPNYAKAHHVNIDDLVLVHPETGEDALNITERFVESGKVDIVTVDSVSALTPKAEIEGEMGDSHVGLQARMMSQALRKLASKVNRSKCTVIFINQLRTKIGVMFGNPETTSGGNALKFYSSIRLDVRKKEMLGNKENPEGIRQKIKCVKNKVAPPFKRIELNMYFNKGYSVAEDLLDNAVNFGIVIHEGKTFTYKDISIVKYWSMIKEIQKNGELRKALKKEVWDCFNGQERTE